MILQTDLTTIQSILKNDKMSNFNSERDYENSPRSSRDDRDSAPRNSRPQRTDQEYRDYQQKKYKADILTFRLGQIFGLTYNLALLAVIYRIFQAGEKTLALQIFALNAAVISFAFLVTAIERRIFNKRHPRNKNWRGGNNRRPDDRRSTSSDRGRR